jgi:hypothetical protein
MFSLTRMATQWALSKQHAAIELPTTTQPLATQLALAQQRALTQDTGALKKRYPWSTKAMNK